MLAPGSVRTLSLSVVIPTLGRRDSLLRALDALAACDPGPTEVLVVDGDEGGGARAVVEPAAATTPFAVRHVQAPRGLTRQRNVGLREVSGDVVLFLDDDAAPAPDALGRLLAPYADPGVVGVTGRVVEPASNAVGGKTSRVRRLLPGGPEGTFTGFGYPRRLLAEEIDHDVEFMSGCFMSARIEAARTTGFDERLPGYALAEDEDFSYRLSRLGTLRYLGQAVVRHDNGGFGGRDRRAFGRQVVRHRRYLFEKNFPQTWTSRALFRLLLLTLLVHRLLNRDLPGARGLLEETLRPRPLDPAPA